VGGVAFGLVLGWWAVLIWGPPAPRRATTGIVAARSTAARWPAAVPAAALLTAAVLAAAVLAVATTAALAGGRSGAVAAAVGALAGAALHLGFLRYAARGR
jgi:hypothetical protein